MPGDFFSIIVAILFKAFTWFLHYIHDHHPVIYFFIAYFLYFVRFCVTLFSIFCCIYIYIGIFRLLIFILKTFLCILFAPIVILYYDFKAEYVKIKKIEKLN